MFCAIPSRRFACTSLTRQLRTYSAPSSAFKEGDRVIVQSLKQGRDDGYFSKPLAATGSIQCNAGNIKGSEVIGKQSRQTVTSSKGTPCRILEPTLAEYVCLTKRLVTPIYPANTNILVSLLDLHPPHPGDRIDILEAGTGHGALTLHLARAIHGANPPRDLENDTEEALNDWRKARSAVLHTVDVSEKHSAHARKIVQGFRRGVYYGDVDFHVGDLPEFFESVRRPDKRFLTHVILDMPSADDRLPIVTQYMRDDAILLVFNPSVSQIAECVKRIEADNLPLQMEQVLELAPTLAGGREWDVRVARVKKSSRLPAPKRVEPQPSGLWSLFSRLWSPAVAKPVATAADPPTELVMVSRPRAGYMVPVGGFVGVWRRKTDEEHAAASS